MEEEEEKINVLNRKVKTNATTSGYLSVFCTVVNIEIADSLQQASPPKLAVSWWTVV